MKQVGIITFHRTNNYGAALQSYALQQVLNKQYNAEILDYRSPYLESLYLGNTASIKNKVRTLARKFIYPIKTKQLDKRKQRFMHFYQQFQNLSAKSYDISNIDSANASYDFFIAGSDQIWNPHLSRGDWNYFLEFAPACKRYSYAASISSNNTNEENNRIRNDLDQFQSVLVRERTAVDFLKSIGLKKNVFAVCDPVFLLSADEWKKMLPMPGAVKRKKYILLYTVASVSHSGSVAHRIAKEKDLTIIYISSNQSVRTVSGMRNILDAGPIEFLDYIQNAECVVTSSFHAMAFSIIFNVPFYYELCKDGSNNNERLENVAEVFNLKSREIINEEQITDIESIDWKSVNLALSNYRKKSINILLNSLKGYGGDGNEQIS